MPGSVVELRRSIGEPIFSTNLPLGAALNNGANEVLVRAENEATRTRMPVISDEFVGRRIPKPYVAIAQPVASSNRSKHP
jgi:hypothetical protein